MRQQLAPTRFAVLPVASIASSTASRGTQDASTPREIQSVRRRPATTPVWVIDADHADPQPAAQANNRAAIGTDLPATNPGIEDTGGRRHYGMGVRVARSDEAEFSGHGGIFAAACKGD